MPLVTVRNAQESDTDFAYAVRERSMRQYVEQTWGEWNEGQARNQIAEDILHSRLSIIEVNREPAGMLRVDEHGTHMDIDQLFLLPEFQNQGIGTSLLQGILARAKDKRLPVRLWVLRVNPARSLYERLGFLVLEETSASLHLHSAA